MRNTLRMTRATLVSRRSAPPVVPVAAWRSIGTPQGAFVVSIDGLGRLATGWRGDDDGCTPRGRRRDDLLPSLCERLASYFGGEPVKFDDVDVPGGPAFHRACWLAAQRVPRGSTISYGELARRAGSSGAARAAGQAMRSNPVPIIVPCHRVIASSGALHGFGGSCDAEGRELGRKRWLLALEASE